MFDNTWKTWAILTVAFVGGCFEVFKHVPLRDSASWEEENLHYGADGKPYAVHISHDSYTARTQGKPVHVAGDSKVLQEEMKKFVVANKATQTEAEHKADAKKADDKKKKKKKKDKKDAKKDDKLADPSKAIIVAQSPAPEDNGAAAIAAAVSEAANTGVLPPAKPSANEPFASLQEWEHRLLNHPDLSATNQFIQEFKNHTVSADIFYTITKMMIADPRPDMKQLGIMAAGSTFSVMSFEILAGVTKSKASSDLITKANSFLNQYSSPGNLGILQNVLRSGDVTSETLAAHLVDTAITTAKQQPNPNPTSQGTNPNVTTFRPFLPLLNTLTQSHDASLAAQARQTLQDLQSFGH